MKKRGNKLFVMLVLVFLSVSVLVKVLSALGMDEEIMECMERLSGDESRCLVRITVGRRRQR